MAWFAPGLMSRVLVVGPVAAVFFSTLFAFSALVGCVHQRQSSEPIADRLGRAVSNAVRAAAETTGSGDIAERAVENAEACRNAAAQYLEGLAASNAVGQTAAAEALKTAVKEALEAHDAASRIARHTENVSNAVVAVKELVEQVPAAGAGKAEALAAKAQDLSSFCVKESAAARRLSNELKVKWLLLLPYSPSTPRAVGKPPAPVPGPGS